MARVQHQDRDAFAILVGRHLNAIHAFNYRFTRNPEDAADLAQETFLRVWQNAVTWQPGRVKFSTWLHRIARNLCIDAFRRARPAVPLQAEPIDREAPPPDASSEQAELRRVMHRALAALPERQRTALLLCHRGMKGRDAAAVLEVSVEALESLLARARRTLREQLREYR